MYDYKVPELSDTMREIVQLAKQIREKKAIMKDEARIQKASTKPIMPRTAAAKVRDRSVSRLKRQMEDLGLDMEDTESVSKIFALLVSKHCLAESEICIAIVIIYDRHTLPKRKDVRVRYRSPLGNVCDWNLFLSRELEVVRDRRATKWA